MSTGSVKRTRMTRTTVTLTPEVVKAALCRYLQEEQGITVPENVEYRGGSLQVAWQEEFSEYVD